MIKLLWDCKGDSNDHFFILSEKEFSSKNQKLKDYAY